MTMTDPPRFLAHQTRKYAFVLIGLVVCALSLLHMDVINVREAARDIQSEQSVPVDEVGNPPKPKPSTSPPTPPPTLPPKPQYKRATSFPKQVTVVIQLSGEMANNLQHIAHGIGLQQLLREDYGVDDCNLVLRHHEGPNNRAPKPKWKSARNHIQECFPKLADWKFAQGNNKKDFPKLQRLQKDWLGADHDHLTGMVNSGNLTEIRQGLDFLVNRVLTDKERPNVDSASPIRLPYLFSQTLDAFPMMDRYYDTLRGVFQFNETACCAHRPDSGDVVFHFRNYQSEMPDWRAYDMGFAEVSPHQTAHELFRDLSTDTVKITTRIPNQKARDYVLALQQERNLTASLVTEYETMPMNDFCFLYATKYQLVGNARSTFVLWAAYLGNMQQARLYHINNTGLFRRHPNFWDRFTYNWTNSELRRKIQWELYQMEGEK